MNKIQLMLDVVKTMKEKESFQGTLKAVGTKDQVKVFGVDNEFARNTVTGATKVKINTEFDDNGNYVKHESNTEFNLKDFHPQMHPGFHRQMQMRCQAGGPGAFPFHGHPGMHGGGLKGGLSRIGFLLHVLNNIKLEEKPDQSYVLSLSLNELPEDIKQMMHERMNQEEFRQHFEHGAHRFIKDLHSVENPALMVKVDISKKYEVEKIGLEFSGQRKDENNAEQVLNAKAELSFNW